ncbi:MAG: hypothetical protein GF330_02150 [Candidatus Eisenbacteria bacterium]|nr:hypothetical protein [Candidatus Eisenbacteria bacterium]
MPDVDPSAEQHPERAGVSTLDFLVRLLRWRKMVLINTGIVAVAAVVISLLLPKWFEAHTSVLPPQEESLTLGPLSSGEVGSALSAAGEARLALSGRMSLPMWATPSDLLSGILRSQRLAEAVIEEHDLRDVYRSETLDEALDTFDERVRVRVGAEGIVRVRVLDKSPERAAAIARSCLAHLDRIQHETRTNRAAEVRRFVDARLATTRRDLAAAEESLRAFEQAHGMLEPQEQARVLVEALARLEAERLLVEVERDALRGQVGAAHPEVRALETRLEALAAARERMEGQGRGARDALDLTRFPDLSLDYMRRYREMRIQESLFEMLTQMREQYRIMEVRDTPTIQVLSPPVVPEKRVKPRRAMICVIATLLAFLLSLGLAATLERVTLLAEREPRRFAQLQRLLAGLGLAFLVPRSRARSS